MQAPAAHVALLVDFANLRLGLAEQLERDGKADEESRDEGQTDVATGRPPATSDIARALVAYTEGLGRLGFSSAYADWSRIPQTARKLGGTRLLPVLVPATEDGEDRSHIKLTVDAVACLYNGDEPDAFVLVSSDPTLVPLVEIIRADGSEVVVVASKDTIGNELRQAADRFVDLASVLTGEQGEPILPRAWRTEKPTHASKGHAKSVAPRNGKANENGREPAYVGPRVADSDFENYEWSPFIQLIDELESRLPFVGVRYLVNKVLAPHNCGVDDPRIKRDLINQAVDDGVIEMYSVGNVDNRTDPVTACRLDRENTLVMEVLAASADDSDDSDGFAGSGVSEDLFADEGAREVATAAE